MKPTVPHAMWLVPAGALALPPFLLVPLVGHLAGAQFFKDLYEACLWVSPAVGLIVLGLILRRRRTDPGILHHKAAIAAAALAGLDLVSPFFFYVLLALLAGH